MAKNINLKKLISQMTLEEKVGQLIQLNGENFTKSASEITGPVQSWGISEEWLNKMGSTLNFPDANTMVKIQKKHLENDPHKIPMLFMMDVIHGYRTIFPIPLGLAASFDPALVYECSRMAAREASAGGVNVTFTPMVDYARDARWGRVMETAGEDPYLACVMGATQVRAFQGDDLSDKEHIAACVKHYAAYGGAEAGRDYNTVEVSERLLREDYLPAYKACIDAGVRMIMPSFNSLNGVPSIANKWLMRKVLKKEWKFDGVVISDYNAIGELKTHGIAPNMREAAKIAFENGCDIEMMSNGYYENLCSLVREGVIDEKDVDKAVYRVLKLKKELGLFDDPYRGASYEKEMALALCPEHRAIARRAACESAVLLKNDGVLPFSKDVKKIALIGPFADSNEIKGFWSCHGKDADCVTVLEGVRAAMPDAEISVANGCSPLWNEKSTEGFAEAVSMAKEADAVVLCLGEPQTYSGEGNSRADIRLPGMQEELAKAIIAANPNCAAVLFNGRPLALTGINNCPAILEMWFPGSEGGNAAADLLFGNAVPCGKLTMSFPKEVGQCPIYYNHPSTGRPKWTAEDVHQRYASNYIGCGNLPLYCFGHGLSYTKFEYEAMELSGTRISAEESLTVSIKVKNAGKYAAKETVQLYIRDIFASTVRPVQQLVAFEKIFLAPGEAKTVTFTVTEEMLRFYDADCKHVSEAGEFVIFTGYADHRYKEARFRLD
ncbi:MAG: beta-glucosidase [Ruminococcaceae bacterium]|nr:beta-glucosidase [Oscillospiraceae bacterium]